MRLLVSSTEGRFERVNPMSTMLNGKVEENSGSRRKIFMDVPTYSATLSREDVGREILSRGNLP